MSKIEKAFKPHVIKMVTDKGAVFEQTIYIASLDELEAERDAQLKPDLSKAVTTQQLVETLNGSEILKRVFVDTAIEHKAQLFVPTKRTLLQKLKGLFQ